MAEVGSTFVTVAPSARGFGSKLDSEIGGEVKKSGSRSGKLFGGAMKLAAGAAIGGGLVAAGFLKGAFSEAREAQKVGALTNAVIKSTGGVANVTAKDVDRLSTALSKKTGVDDEAIAAGQNMLLTFGNVRNEVGKGNDIFTQATVAASDMAAAFGGDAVSNSKMLGKALNDPTKGVSALTRVGVSFTQQQKDQIKTLQASGDTIGAQKIILGELTKQTGGAAEASATAGDKFKVAFGNLQESVGTALLPLFDKLLNGATRFVTFLTNDIGPGIAALNGYLAPAITAVKGFFTAGAGGAAAGGLLSTFKSIGASIATNFLPVIKTMATTFTTTILPVLTRVGGYLSANLMPIFRQVGSVIATQVIPIVASLAQFFYARVLPAIVSIVVAVGQRLKPVFDAIFQVIRTSVLPSLQRLLAKFREYQPTIQKVIVIVLKVIGVVLKFAAAILGKVLPPLIRFAGFLLRNLVGAVITAISVLARIIGFVVRVGAAFIEGQRKVARFASDVRAKVGQVAGFIGSIPGRARAALGNLGGLLLNAGRELVQGLINGISSKINAVRDKMRELASAVKGFLPGSPVKEGPLTSWNRGGAGKRLVGLLADGLSDTREVDAAMARLSRRIQVAAPSIDGTITGRAVAGGGSAAASGRPVNIYEAASPMKTLLELARLESWESA